MNQLIILILGLSTMSLFAKHHKDAGSSVNHHMHQTDFEELVARFEDPARTAWQQPEKVIALMGDLEGKTVADIGAGTGYFAFPIARKGARVLALDIDERFLAYIKKKNETEKLPVETRKVPTDGPGLADGEADIVLIVNTYHHIDERPVYFAKVRQRLKPGGFLLVVDFKDVDLPVGPPRQHKLSAKAVQKELKKAGYEKITVDADTLSYQYIIKAK